jgi:opacity protein-like surface antigen
VIAVGARSLGSGRAGFRLWTCPLLKGGAGIVRADYTTRWISDWFDNEGNHYVDPAFETVHASKFGIDLGAGVKAPIGRNFLVRAEVQIVDTTPGEGYNWGVLLLNTGIGYSW